MQRLAIQDDSRDLNQSVNIGLEKRQNWLLIFDGLSIEENGDIAGLSKVAPDSKDSHIIYVARSSSLSILRRLKIGPLSKEASRILLLKEMNLGKVNERQKAKATEIVESVGGLPLAIHAIARHLADTRQPLEQFTLPASNLSLERIYEMIFDDLLSAGRRFQTQSLSTR